MYCGPYRIPITYFGKIANTTDEIKHKNKIIVNAFINNFEVSTFE